MVSHNCWSPTICNKYLDIEIWYLREGSVIGNSTINNLYIQFEFSYGKEVFETTNALTLPSDYVSHCYICVLYSKILLMLISGFCKIPHVNFTQALTHQGWETYMCQYTIPLVTLLYPPNNEVVGGYIGFTPSVCPSVCPSVRLSRLPCPLCNTYSSGWILSILATNDHYHERVCRTQWPLTLTYIFKVIQPWLRKLCPLCSVYSSEWILFIFGTNDHYH